MHANILWILRRFYYSLFITYIIIVVIEGETFILLYLHTFNFSTFSLSLPSICLSLSFPIVILSIANIFYWVFFMLQDDRYFLSGSLDGKLRLWNIPEKKVTMWNEVSSLITTANFCHNGKFAVAGTYDGKCIFYTTEVNTQSHESKSKCSPSLYSNIY